MLAHERLDTVQSGIQPPERHARPGERDITYRVNEGGVRRRRKRIPGSSSPFLARMLRGE
jgi:hypothetical protein